MNGNESNRMEKELKRIIKKAMKELNFAWQRVPDGVWDIASNAISWTGIVRSTVDTLSKMRIKSMIRGISADNTDVRKLYDCVLRSTNNADYIVTLFYNAFRKSSKLAVTMMGAQIAELSSRDDDVSQIDMVVLDALISFNDFDIKNFIKIYENIPQDDSIEANDLKQVCVYSEGIDITLSKCVSVGLLNIVPAKAKEAVISVNFAYSINAASEKFYDMANKNMRNICN